MSKMMASTNCYNQSVGLHRTRRMKTHFQRAIRPLTVTATVFGFALIEYPDGTPRRLLSLLYAIVSFTLQVTMLTIKFVYLDPNDTIFLSWISWTILGYISLNILVLAGFSQWHGKRYYQCLEAMNEIDETLRGLGIETDYSRLRRIVVVTVIAWMSWISMLNITSIILASSDMNQIHVMITLFILHIPLHVPIIVDMHFWFVVGYAGTRFDCINSALREFALDDNDYIGWLQNKKAISVRGTFILNEKNKRIIWTTMHLHFRLCNILYDVTRMFETQLYMEIGLSFQYLLCSMIYTLRLMLIPFEGNKYKYCTVIWIWAVLHILKIFITNYICENIRAKAMTVSDIAVRLICNMGDEKMREDKVIVFITQLVLIALQTKHKPLRFSCLGLDYFGYQFLYEIVSTMVTMTVIVLQLKTGLK